MKLISLIILGLLSTAAFSSEKTICQEDDRIPSFEPKVGRALENAVGEGGCTLTMISDSCAISAGHCKRVLGVGEFNTPPSVDGKIVHPDPEDVYEVDKDTLKSTYTGLGNDWAVFKMRPNNITGRLPGAVQGFYNVSFEAPKKGQTVRITGYGLDRQDPERNLAQQTNDGSVVAAGTSRSPSVFQHNIDTMGGNSGSSIIREIDQTIVAIHTNGGCGRRGGANSATMIATNPELVAAIRSCLDSETKR